MDLYRKIEMDFAIASIYPKKQRTKLVIKYFVKMFEEQNQDQPTQREIAENLGIGLRTVQRYFVGNKWHQICGYQNRPFTYKSLDVTPK